MLLLRLTIRNLGLLLANWLVINANGVFDWHWVKKVNEEVVWFFCNCFVVQVPTQLLIAICLPVLL